MESVNRMVFVFSETLYNPVKFLMHAIVRARVGHNEPYQTIAFGSHPAHGLPQGRRADQRGRGFNGIGIPALRGKGEFMVGRYGIEIKIRYRERSIHSRRPPGGTVRALDNNVIQNAIKKHQFQLGRPHGRGKAETERLKADFVISRSGTREADISRTVKRR